MINKDIDSLKKFLIKNCDIPNMETEEKNKYKYFIEEITKIENQIPSIKKIEELKKIEIELEIKFEELYELGNYFDPVYIKIKNYIHEENVLKIREKNRKK